MLPFVLSRVKLIEQVHGAYKVYFTQLLRAHTYTHAHTHAHTRTHTYTYAHTHIHTHALAHL